MGLKETEATTFLEKKIKADSAMSYEKAVQTAISALQVCACIHCSYERLNNMKLEKILSGLCGTVVFIWE